MATALRWLSLSWLTVTLMPKAPKIWLALPPRKRPQPKQKRLPNNLSDYDEKANRFSGSLFLLFFIGLFFILREGGGKWRILI